MTHETGKGPSLHEHKADTKGLVPEDTSYDDDRYYPTYKEFLAEHPDAAVVERTYG